MLTMDEGKVRAHRAQEQIFKTRDLTLNGSRAEARDAHLVSDKHKSVANADRQAGRKMSATEFINKLRKINPDIVLEPHPGVSAPVETAFHRLNKDKACLHLTIGGSKQFLMVCEGDYMPEWTVMDTRVIKKPDASSPDGMWKPAEIPWHCVKRGWREVLIRLIRMRIVSLEPVEKVFGAGDRSSWKTLTGKGPWE